MTMLGALLLPLLTCLLLPSLPHTQAKPVFDLIPHQGEHTKVVEEVGAACQCSDGGERCVLDSLLVCRRVVRREEAGEVGGRRRRHHRRHLRAQLRKWLAKRQ